MLAAPPRESQSKPENNKPEHKPSKVDSFPIPEVKKLEVLEDMELDFTPSKEAVAMYEATMPPELAGYCNQVISKAAEKARGLETDPEAIRLIDEAAEELRWRLVAPPGSPLPDNLVLVMVNEQIGPQVDRRPNAAIAFDREFNVLVEKKLAGVLDDIYEVRKDYYGKITDYSAEEVAKSLVEQQPIFQFLKSFDNKTSDQAQKPLSPLEIQVREKQIETTVRREFGLADNDRIERGSAADRKINRAKYALEEETRLGSVDKKTKSPFERLNDAAKDWLFEKGKVQLEKQGIAPNGDIGAIDRYQLGRISAIDTSASNVGDVYHNISVRLYDDPMMSKHAEISLRDGVGDFCGIEPSWDGKFKRDSLLFDSVIGSTFLHLRNPRYISPDLRPKNYYGEMLDRIKGQVANDFVRICAQTQRGNSIQDVESFTWAKQPSGPVYTFDSWYEQTLESKAWSDMSERSIYFDWLIYGSGISEVRGFDYTSKETMLKKEKQTVARIKQRPDSGMTDEMVLIDFVDFHVEAEDIDYEDKDQLIITVPNKSKKKRPVIAGFSMVGSTKKRDGVDYAFIPEEKDLYNQPDLDLLKPQIIELTKMYKDLDLTVLAGKIEEKEELTLYQLTELIRENSVYVFGKPKEYDSLHDYDGYGSLLEKMYVKDGKALVQCDSANVLLQKSLQTMFDKSSAKVVGGHVIAPRRKRVSGMKHAQTLFVDDEGVRRVLDVTPSGSYGAFAGLSMKLGEVASFDWRNDEGGRGIEFKKRAKRKKATKKLTELVVKTIVIEDVEPTETEEGEIGLKIERVSEVKAAEKQKKQQTAIWNSLKLTLREAFDIKNDDKLYEKLNALKEADPVRRAGRSLVRAAGDSVDNAQIAQELEELHKYLENYKNAKPEMIKKIGVDAYDKNLIDALVTAVKSSRSLLEQ